ELDWKDEALDVWERISLRNHARLYPDVPFGIFNGPDCYSSHYAGEREGWTQVQMLERAKFPPMNPMVAWQALSLGLLGNPLCSDNHNTTNRWISSVFSLPRCCRCHWPPCCSRRAAPAPIRPSPTRPPGRAPVLSASASGWTIIGRLSGSSARRAGGRSCLSATR